MEIHHYRFEGMSYYMQFMNLIRSLFVILAFISILSCDREKKIADRRTLLTNKWLIDSVMVPDSIRATLEADSSYDFAALYTYLADLQSRGYFEFRSDSSFIVDLPPTKIDKGHWALADNDNYLRAFFIPAYYGVPSDSPRLSFEMKLLTVGDDSALFLVDNLVFKVRASAKK